MHTSSAPAMGDQQDVNVKALDALVLEYAKVEGLVDGCTPSSISGLKHVCIQVRQLIHAGHIPDALDLIQASCPAVLEDQCLLFKMKKQQFIELLRQGSVAGDQAALACARNELAPLALGAHPEAYSEFKALLLLLVYDRSSGGSGGGASRGVSAQPALRRDWGDEARSALAASVYHTMRQQLGWLDPLLALLLRYLMHIASCYEQSAGSAPVPDAELRAALVPAGARDAGPLPHEGGAARLFPAADVQALVHAAGVPRAEAVEALKGAAGDADGALLQLLMRMPLASERLDALVREYACYRGLLSQQPEEGLGRLDGEQQQAPSSWEAGPHSGWVVSASVSQAGGSNGGSSCGSSPHRERGVEGGKRAKQSSRSQASPPHAPLSGVPDAPCAHPHKQAPSSSPRALSASRSESQSPPYKKHKVLLWRGRRAPEGCTQAEPLLAGSSGAGRGKFPSPLPGQGAHAQADAQQQALQPPAALLQLHQLASEGRWDAVVTAAEGMCPRVWEAQPALLFELRRCQHAQLVAGGDVVGALAVARQQLAPLADAHPALLPLLKQAMASLLPGVRPPAGAAPPPEPAAVVAGLQAALQRELGLAGPRLLGLLKVLLAAHRAWYRSQRCADPFQALLQLEALKRPHPGCMALAGGGGGAAEHANPADGCGGGGGGARSGVPAQLAAAAAFGGGGRVLGDMSDGDGSDDSDGGFPESSILQLQEIFELSRAAAVEVLAEHAGDVEVAIHQLLQG